MRLFVAVELDDAVKAAAAAAARDLRSRLAAVTTFDARWLPADNLHITLWFLGEVGEDRAAAVTAAFHRPFDLPAFSIEVGGWGAFPPSGAPRVLWMGVRQGEGALAAVHAAVGERLRPLEFDPGPRAFAAHLTLARVRASGPARSGHAAVRGIVAGASADAGRSRVSHVTLFRSRLSPAGARHDPVLRVPLKG